MINAIENGTHVIMSGRRAGKVQVTRRERQLISDGKLDEVSVLCTDGLSRTYRLDEFEIDEEEFRQTVIDNHTKEVILERLYKSCSICSFCSSPVCSHKGNRELPPRLTVDDVVKAINYDEYFFKEEQ